MRDTMIFMIEHYGYLAVFVSMVLGIVGLPLPIEFLLVFIGSITAATHLNMYWIVAVAWIGLTIGMMVNYYLGKTIGIARISKITKWIHLPEEKLNQWAVKFQKFGPILILAGFFIGGLRHASPFIAGASGMSLKKFTGLTLGGGLGWICLLTFLGHRIGGQWHHIMKLLHHPWFVITLAVVILGLLALKKYRGKLQPWMDEMFS